MTGWRNTDSSTRRTRSQYWRGLSDDEVLSRQLDIGDPEKLPNLLQQEPQGDEVPEVEFEYDTLISGTGKVRCVHCKKTAKNHNRGYVMQFADGRRMLIGKNCGEKIYHAEWGGVEHDFKAIKSRRSLLEQKAWILARRGEIIPLIEELAGADCWAFYARHRGAFVHAFSTEAVELAQVVDRLDGRLSITQPGRDEVAEADFEARTGRKSGPILRHVSVEIGTLSGKEFFTLGPYPGKQIADLTRRLINSLHVLGNDEAKSNHHLKTAFVGIAGIVDQLGREAERCDTVESALSPTNLSLIARWLGVAGGKYALKRGKFYRHDAAGNVVYREAVSGDRITMLIDVPDHFPPPVSRLVERIRALLSSS